MRFWFPTLVVLTLAAATLAQDALTLTPRPAATTAAEEPPATLRERRQAQDQALLTHLAQTLSPYQPVYFLAGPEDPIVKFQISFKYQFVPAKSDLGEAHPWLSGFHVAYSQTSLWDIGSPSSPFFDNSYRPEVFWLKENLFGNHLPDNLQLDLQFGFQHESNGKGGADSRSMNSLYLEPTLTIGLNPEWFFAFSPRIFGYFSDLEDNPDITDYRGYVDWKFTLGQYDGFQASVIGRLGEYGDKGSIQLDLSYPLIKTFPNSPNLLCLHLQVFNGFGESLVDYNESDTTVRIGLSLVR